MFLGCKYTKSYRFSLIASLYIIYDLNFLIVLSGSIFASILVYLLSNLIGNLSQKYGIPVSCFTKNFYWFECCKIFSMLRGIIGIFFFGVQTFFISKSIVYLIRISFFYIDPNILNKELFLFFFLSLNLIDWIALIITFIFQFYLFTKGHHVSTKSIIKFSALFVYFGLILFLIIIASENSQKLFLSFNQLNNL